MNSNEPSTPGVANVSMKFNDAQRQYQQLLDRITPFVLYRWLGTAGLLAVFALRIVLSQGVSTQFYTCEAELTSDAGACGLVVYRYVPSYVENTHRS